MPTQIDDCSRHKKEVAGITDMKLLAEMIGDLHYETLADLFKHLATKISLDSKKDKGEGKIDLSECLWQLSVFMAGARGWAEDAWKISKPFMEDKTKEA